MANRYSVPLKYLVNLNSHLNFKFEGKIKFIAVTYTGKPMTKLADKSCHNIRMMSSVFFYVVSSDQDLIMG